MWRNGVSMLADVSILQLGNKIKEKRKTTVHNLGQHYSHRN